MFDLEKVRYPSMTLHTHTDTTQNTNTVVALAQAENKVRLGWLASLGWARLTDTVAALAQGDHPRNVR